LILVCIKNFSARITQQRFKTMYEQLQEGLGNILGFKIVGGITKKTKGTDLQSTGKTDR
jgi:hypothetical protein